MAGIFGCISKLQICGVGRQLNNEFCEKCKVPFKIIHYTLKKNFWIIS